LLAFIVQADASSTERHQVAAIERARSAGTLAMELEWTLGLPTVWAAGAMPMEAAVRRTRALRSAHGGRSRRAAIACDLALATMEASAGRVDESQALLEGARGAIEETGIDSLRGFALDASVLSDMLADRVDEAEEAANAWVAASEAEGPDASRLGLWYLAIIRAEAGDGEGALRVLDALEPHLEPSNLHVNAAALSTRGLATALTGSLVQGLAIASRAVDLMRRSDFSIERARGLAHLSEVLRLAGDRDRAVRARTKALDLLTRKGAVPLAERQQKLLEALR
jgi:hypothetical protein